MRRPAIFALLFWGVFLLTCVSYAFGLNREEHRFGAPLVVLALAVLAAAWVALPWDARASRARKGVAPAFLLVTLAVGYLTGSLWSVGLYAIPFASGVFLFGYGRGVAYALAVLSVVFAHYLVYVSVTFPERGGAATTALLVTVFWIPVGVFVMGVCAAIMEAVRRREEAQTLLAELEAAHAELARRAERTRELAVAEERARMAREIHDSVGHHLTVVNLQLQNALRLEERNPEKAREQVREAKRFTLEALSEVRRSVRALKPLALEEGSGAGALAALARSFEGAGPEVRFGVRGEERELSPDVELALYRTLQEGLTNASKHSGACRVTATLSFGDERVRLTVADDGDGASHGGAGGARDGGFGLVALRERAEALGGTARFGDAEGGGFVLEMELPASRAGDRSSGGLPNGSAGRDGAPS